MFFYLCIYIDLCTNFNCKSSIVMQVMSAEITLFFTPINVPAFLSLDRSVDIITRIAVYHRRKNIAFLNDPHK